MRGRWPNEYEKSYPDLDVKWRWVDLWEQENPAPGKEDWDEWYVEHKKMMDRVWVAAVMPQFRVWDWKDEDVALARRIVARHVCGVCGRTEDPGCVYGC